MVVVAILVNLVILVNLAIVMNLAILVNFMILVNLVILVNLGILVNLVILVNMCENNIFCTFCFIRVAEVARTRDHWSPLAQEPQHTRFCREISFVAIYTLLDVPFSAIHGDEWLFHDYDASAGLPMVAQGCQR